MPRHKYKLSLKRRKFRHQHVSQKLQFRSSWPTIEEEVFGSRYCNIINRNTPKQASAKRPRVKTFSSSKSNTPSRRTYNQFYGTPSKSPFAKRFKTVIRKRNLFCKSDTDCSRRKVHLTPETTEYGVNDPFYEDFHAILDDTASENFDAAIYSGIKTISNKTEDVGKEIYDNDIIDTNAADRVSKDYIASAASTQVDIEEINKLVPSVLDKLSKHEFDKTLLDFFRLVDNEKFPIENIAFALWMEVVKWFSCTNTSEMRYSDVTKKFWKLGYRTFGGQFVRFMSGYKNTDCIVTGGAKKGVYSPSESSINFAVPDMNVIRYFQPYDVPFEQTTNRTPGIYNDIIQSMANTMDGKSCCLTFDGKKLKRGLTKTGGDVDILGFEKGCSLMDRKEAQKKLLQPIATIKDLLADLSETADVDSMSNTMKHTLYVVLRDALKDVSTHILDMQDVRKKKEYAKEKFIERSGDSDWRNGKYVLVISSMIAFIYDIDKFHENSISLIEEITKCISSLSSTKVSERNAINVNEGDRYHQIKEAAENEIVPSTRVIKQRTPEWFEKRKQAKVTGSTLYRAVGLDGLQKQKEHFDTVICGVPEKVHSEKTQEALHYGTVNEINATATFVGKVMPLLFPEHQCFEEGYIEIGEWDRKPFMVVSPDGSVRSSRTEASTLVGIELKCPILKQVHKQLPSRYLLQCLSEIEALNVDSLIYLCWTPEISTMFRVKRNTTLFNKAYSLAESFYKLENPRRPSKLAEASKLLKRDIEMACLSESTVEFIGLIPSMRHDESVVNVFRSDNFRISRVLYMLDNLEESHQTYYNLKREPASEAVVFLCCDLNREWERDSIRCAPLSWFPKGYSLDTATLRSLLETILDACSEAGLHIPALSFDGQWHNIAVRNVDDEALTLLQLQKSVWKKVECVSKADLLKKIISINKLPKWTVKTEKDKQGCNKRVIVASYIENRLPTLSESVIRHRLREQKKKSKNEENTDNIQKSSVLNSEKESEEYVELTMQKGPVDEDIADGISLYTFSNADIASATDCSTTESVEGVSNQQAVEATDISWNNMGNHVSTDKITIGEHDAASILVMLQTDKISNTKGQWDNKTTSDILEKLKSAKDLSSCRDVDLRILIRYIKRVFKAKIKESENKQTKVSRLCDLFGIPFNLQRKRNNKQRKSLDAKKLYEIAADAVSKVMKKSDLNIIYAEYLWHGELENWNKNYPMSLPFPNTEDLSEIIVNNVNVSNTDDSHSNISTHESDILSQRSFEVEFPAMDIMQPVHKSKSDSDNRENHNFWFYSPAYSKKRQQFEVSCIDSSHLLTRTRRKCCKGGLDGLSNKAWREIAKTNKTPLSLAMIDCSLDPMSVSMALTHFSEPVEMAMRNNGDLQEANLCKDIRTWWSAEDDPGIPAKERINMRMALRQRLLGHIDFGRFPPPTMHIKGWPLQLWEALIANIDAKIQLYYLTKNKTYNVRAFSSMMGETFFSELTMYDRRGHGTVTTEEFGQFICTSMEKIHMRLDPKRPFCYRTSRKPVYNLVGQSDDVEQDKVHNIEGGKSQQNVLRGHPFDDPGRARLKAKKKLACVNPDRNSLQKGSLGVRWETARRNESKLLPTYRQGKDLQSLS